MKKMFALVLLIFFSGCITGNVVAVGLGDSVNVTYEGRFFNGSVFDSGSFIFTTGSGRVIPGFDSAVMGMRVGESKTVTLPPAEAYGEYYDEPSVLPFETVNNSVFNAIQQNAKVGHYVTLIVNGESIMHYISKIDGELVELTRVKTHPLQGETLVFDITVNSIE